LGVIYEPEARGAKFGDSSDEAKIWRNFSRHVAQRKTGLNSLLFTKPAIFLDTRNQLCERPHELPSCFVAREGSFCKLVSIAAPGSEWDNKFPV
jgi:hypothetical protein